MKDNDDTFFSEFSESQANPSLDFFNQAHAANNPFSPNTRPE